MRGSSETAAATAGSSVGTSGTLSSAFSGSSVGATGNLGWTEVAAAGSSAATGDLAAPPVRERMSSWTLVV